MSSTEGQLALGLLPNDSGGFAMRPGKRRQKAPN
jgi:hypothetical protein